GRMNDFKLISLENDPSKSFTPEASVALHRRSRAFLRRMLNAPFDGPTVVVTHHGPHPNSINARYLSDVLNPAFGSDLAALIESGRPKLWIHGHVHSSFDYRVGATRILCNPRGYGNENPGFDPLLVVDI